MRRAKKEVLVMTLNIDLPADKAAKFKKLIDWEEAKQELGLK
ncbi:MAG: hypothetical protein ACE5I1_19935 [bacterium]